MRAIPITTYAINFEIIKTSTGHQQYKKPLTHEVAGITTFTKVDGCSSYYGIVIAYELSLLTTFNTHRGRYRFVHLPF